ncbi:hypothetical protein LJC35_03800 [Parabacteroides sp. OttesenSCG-928-N08]|nr:hypothetical protein [Parabacteroides sp. OttesenSCG-928-N08]
MAEAKKKKKKRRASLIYIFGGGLLREDFILRHLKMILLIVGLIIAFISNNYICMQKIRQIDRLQQRLRDVRFESLSISTELTGKSRQSQIEELIEAQGLDLETAKTPPYIISK